jgi:hypothetical protein
MVSPCDSPDRGSADRGTTPESTRDQRCGLAIRRVTESNPTGSGIIRTLLSHSTFGLITDTVFATPRSRCQLRFP